MRTPKSVSSDRFIRHLERNFGYKFARQSGSHIILTTESPAHHSLPVPTASLHRHCLFQSLLRQVSQAKGVNIEELLKDL